LKNEHKIIIGVSLCLVSAISFEFGLMQGKKLEQKPLIIEKPIDIPAESQEPKSEASASSSVSSDAIIGEKPATTQNSKNCPYVGSKSSTKFYLATCSWAKRIKPENMVCFKNAEDAKAQGRTESKCATSK
jgi:hypothetical protein